MYTQCVVTLHPPMARGQAKWELAPQVRAVDFGVRADGVSDDTAALQRAIDAAAGAAAVQLPAGTMVVTAALRLETTAMWAPGLKLEGMGKDVTARAANCPTQGIRSWRGSPSCIEAGPP